jgi:hypothetical protein
MLHSPNENVIIEQFETMIECSAALFWRLAERAAGTRSQAELDTVDPIQGVTP